MAKFGIGLNVTRSHFIALENIIARLSRPTAAEQQRIERGVRVGFARNFMRQGVGGGPMWLPLAPRTVRERRAQGYGGSGPILRRRNVYAQSWIRVGGWRQMTRTPAGWTLHVSSGHPWAFTHELGNRARRVPPRPVRYLDTISMRVVGRAVESWVDDVIRSIMT